MFSSIFALLQSLFYPHCCPGCGEEVREPGVLCGRCREGVWHPRSFHPGSLECPHVDGMFFLMELRRGHPENPPAGQIPGAGGSAAPAGGRMGPGNPLGGEILLGPASGSDSVCHRHPHGSPAAEKTGIRPAGRNLPALVPAGRVPVGNPADPEPEHPAPVRPDPGRTEKEHQRMLHPGPAGKSAGYRAALRAKMLGIDTIFGTVCIAEK